jgi:hypothetical protein
VYEQVWGLRCGLRTDANCMAGIPEKRARKTPHDSTA